MKAMKVWVLTKQWFDRYGITNENAWAFSSFRLANRTMYEDWTLEYDLRPDKDRPDDDKFWEEQVAPFDLDVESSIMFRDESRIDWHIHECKVENGEENEN